MRSRWFAVIALACACRTPLTELDGAFYAWDDRAVHCTVEIDDKAGYEWEEIVAGLDRVRETGEVLELLVHRPGESITWERFEALLAGVRERGLDFLTSTDMVKGPPRGGIALMYDGEWLPAWLGSVEMLAKYDARVTIFVSRYARLQPWEHDQIRDLDAAGHDIEAHSVNHLRGPSFVEQHGLQAYLDEEVLPSIDVLRDDGYEVVSFAYPFGTRTSEIDRAILDTGSVPVLRALTRATQLRADPCPID